jgi:preprotein translocase subunit SecA
VQIQSPEQLEEATEQYEEDAAQHLDALEFHHSDIDGTPVVETGSIEGGAVSRSVPASAASAASAAVAGAYGQTDETPLHAPAAHLPSDAVPKVGRNDLCPCGSGKKYKQCHGKLT